MMFVAIDPGPEESAYVVIEDGRIVRAEKVDNGLLLDMLSTPEWIEERVIIEQIKAYEHIGDSALWTVHWCGRFHQVAVQNGMRVAYVPRATVKTHVTGHCRTAKDRHVREAMIDRWGPPQIQITDEEQAHLPRSKRRKYKPGPTAEFRADTWAALAVATWWLDVGSREGATDDAV